MKKKYNLILVTMLLACCFFAGCRTLSGNKHSYNSYNKKGYQVIGENDSILLSDCMSYENTDSLNSLLSRISEKEKIDISDWKTKYNNSGRLIYKDYICYRLIVLYGFNLKEIEPNWESRLDFFISSVDNSDYGILDLLDFQDKALDGNSCYGETILTAAVIHNNIEMVKYLLNRGIDKEKREFPACYDDAQEGKNAYEIAESLGYKKIMNLLK